METVVPRILEFRIPADMRYIAIVRRGVRNLAESVGFTDEAVSDMEVAVSEAVTNSVEHGTPDPSSGAVLVKCCASSDCVVVEVEDEARADACLQELPRSDAYQERGRGITMIRTLMDEFEDIRTENGMRVRMAKQRGRG